MSEPLPLPAHPHLDWLKNRAKARLAVLRRERPGARLAEAQRDVAREYGFPSWRALKARVDALRAAADAEVAPRGAGAAAKSVAMESAGPAPESAAATDAAAPAGESAATDSAATVTSTDEVVGAFLRGVGTGRIDAVRQALATAPALVNAVGPHPFWGGRPQALHVAIESNRSELCDLLLERGADVDGASARYDGWSPLLLSIQRRRSEMTAALLARGARVGLAEALALADDARVDALLDAGDGAAAREPAPSDATWLHFARTTHAIDRLLALGADVHRRDRWGASVIEALSRLGPRGAALVAHLVARGVAAGPAELARVGDRAALARLLASDPATVRTPGTLKAAVDSGHHDLARWLIASGCDVNGRAGGMADETPLHAAAWNGDLEMARMLVESGADLGARDRQHDGTPLDWAETSVEVTNNPACAEVADYLRSRADAGTKA